MKATDMIPEEKLAAFLEATFEIMRDHLQEDIVSTAKIVLLKRWHAVDIFCDGYHRGMAVAIALIEAGILAVEVLEIRDKARE